MKKALLKRWLLVFFALSLMAFALSGCGKGKPEGISSEEFLVTNFYNDIFAEKFDTSYDNFFAPVSKKYISKDDYISASKTSLFTNGITPVGYASTKSEKLSIDDFTIFKIDGLLKCTKDGAETNLPTTDYVLKLNGAHYFLYEGVYKQKKYTMSETDNSNYVHCSIATISTAVDRIDVELLMKNDRPSGFTFGGKSDCVIKITADGKTHSATLKEAVPIAKDSTVTLKASFSEAKGAVEDISVSGIYSVGNNGEILDSGDGQTYTVKVTALAK